MRHTSLLHKELCVTLTCSGSVCAVNTRAHFPMGELRSTGVLMSIVWLDRVSTMGVPVMVC